MESNKKKEIPETWEPHIELMKNAFEKELRITYLPKFFSDFVNLFRSKNRIKEIKISFGELKVIGNFTWQFEQIIRDTKRACRDTCEFCGRSDTEKVIIKSWVHICCDKCKKERKE